MTFSAESIVLIATAIAAVVTALISVVKQRSERRKISADTVSVISSSAIALLAPMEKQVTSLEKKLAAATTRADELELKYRGALARIDELESKHRSAQSRADELESQLEKLLIRLRNYEHDYEGEG